MSVAVTRIRKPLQVQDYEEEEEKNEEKVF
jgi:hypothetical protein